MSNVRQQDGDYSPDTKSRIEQFFAQPPHRAKLSKELPVAWPSDGKAMDVIWEGENSGEQRLLSLLRDPAV